MFGRFVSGVKQALQAQSEPATPMPSSPIPTGRRDTHYQQPTGHRFGSLGGQLDRSPSPIVDICMEGLTEVEKFHILNVVARAESNTEPVVISDQRRISSKDSEPLSTTIAPGKTQEDPKQASRSTSESRSQEEGVTLLPGSMATSIPDVPLDGLTEEERAHILNVMARAESAADVEAAGVDRRDWMPTDVGRNGSKFLDQEDFFPVPERRVDSSPVPAYRMDSSSVPAAHRTDSSSVAAPSNLPVYGQEIEDPSLTSQLENSDLTTWELEQIMSVMEKARRESDLDDEASLVGTVPVSTEKMKHEDEEKYQKPVLPYTQYMQSSPSSKRDIDQAARNEQVHGGDERIGKGSERIGEESERIGKESERIGKESERIGKESERIEEESSDQSSEETEGADEISTSEDASGYSSPVHPQRQLRQNEEINQEFGSTGYGDSEDVIESEIGIEPSKFSKIGRPENELEPSERPKTERPEFGTEAGKTLKLGIEAEKRPKTDLDDPALVALLPEGIELLSEEEQEQIIAVLRRAVMESEPAIQKTEGTMTIGPKADIVSHPDTAEMDRDIETHGRKEITETEREAGKAIANIADEWRQEGQWRQDDEEWHHEGQYPTPAYNTAKENEWTGRISEPMEEDQPASMIAGDQPAVFAAGEQYNDYDDYASVKYGGCAPRDDTNGDSVIRRPPALTFDVHEDTAVEEEEVQQSDYWKGSSLGAKSPVSITIQPPSPCPTDSGSEDEEYWNRQYQARQEAQDSDYEMAEGADEKLDKETSWHRDEDEQETPWNRDEDEQDMPWRHDEGQFVTEEFARQLEAEAEGREKADGEEEGEEGEKGEEREEEEEVGEEGEEEEEEGDEEGDVEAGEIELEGRVVGREGGGTMKGEGTETGKRKLEDLENEQNWWESSPEEGRQYRSKGDQAPAQSILPADQKAREFETATVPQEGASTRGFHERIFEDTDFSTYPPADDDGNEADNEGERYDLFEEGPEPSYYDDRRPGAMNGAGGAALGAALGAPTEYYLDEYQHSESGSSSGYGSRGIMGLSGYTSGEGLSQQSAGIMLHGIDAYGTPSGHGGSLHFVPDTQAVDEIEPERQGITDQMNMDGYMAKSAPESTLAEGVYYDQFGYETQTGKTSDHTMGIYEEDFYAPEPVHDEVESQQHPDIDISTSYPVTLAQKRPVVESAMPEEPKDVFARSTEYNMQSYTEEQRDFYQPSKAYPAVSASPNEQASFTDYGKPERPISQQDVPHVPSKSPERSSFFGSLKQAAAPAQKSSFGSFFSGASQALKSQTEAVLKKAVDTVQQVASAAEVSPKHPPLVPAQTAPLVTGTDSVEETSSMRGGTPSGQEGLFSMKETSSVKETPSVKEAPFAVSETHFPSKEEPPATEQSLVEKPTIVPETMLGEYDYDSPYSLKKLIKHESIVPTKQEVTVQQVAQPIYDYQWSTEQKMTVQEPPVPLEASIPLEPPVPLEARVPMEASVPMEPPQKTGPTVIDLPGMPGLDLSQFNEEERAHLLAMIGKAKEMEEELHSVPSSAAPSRSTSFSQHTRDTPISTVIEEYEEELVPEPYKAPVQATKQFPLLEPTSLPWQVPSIREIGATPECHVDVEEAFTAATQADTQGPQVYRTGQQQQYDSSEVSSTMCEDEDDQQQRMTEIEADLRGEAVRTRQYTAEPTSLTECPLCKRLVLRCSQGSYGSTGQMCADCGVVVCTDCGRVVPRYMGKIWLCGQCQLEDEQGQIEQQLQQQKEDHQMLETIDEGGKHEDIPTYRPAAPRSTASRRRRRRTTAINQRHEPEDEEDYDYHLTSKKQQKPTSRSVAKHDRNDSDESDEEMESQPDDDDYPDEVIEVPPAPPQAGNASMDNGSVDGSGGLGADVLAAITSTFSSSSSEFHAFNDVVIDSTAEQRTHLPSEIAYSSSGSSARTVPPPVPARTHRAAPPPPPSTIPQQLPQTSVFSSTTAPADGSDSVTDTQQWPLKEGSGQYFDPPIGGGWEQKKEEDDDETTNRGVIDRPTGQSHHREQTDMDTRPEEAAFSGGASEDEQAATTGESEEEEEEEQIDYAQAMKYYNNNPFFTHRPGPVYTIPEDEESDEMPGENEESVSGHGKLRPGVSPNYQELLKQHQLRQQQQQRPHQVHHQPTQATPSVPVCQPTAGSIYHKRNPFIDEEQEDLPESVSRPSTEPGQSDYSSTQGDLPRMPALTREVTSVVSSQQYCASQHQQGHSLALIGNGASPQPTTISVSSTGQIPFSRAADGNGRVTTSYAETTPSSVVPTNYAPTAALSEDSERAVPAVKAANNQQAARRNEAPEEQQHVHKRQTATSGVPSIEYASTAAAPVGRPVLAFLDEDVVSNTSQYPVKEKEKGSNLTAVTTSEESLYSQGTTPVIGQLIWQRDDHQEMQQHQPIPTTTTTVHTSAASRSSEDEEAQDLDNQFVSKLKRSPAMILHADEAAAAANARRPQGPGTHQQHGEYLDDILTDETPVAWPTFLAQKIPTPHQLPPFPPPPGTGIRPRSAGASEDPTNIVVSSAQSLTTLSRTGGGAVTAAGSSGGKPPEMGRRKLPSIPQAASGSQSEPPYSVRGHYVPTMSFEPDHRSFIQQQQPPAQDERHHVPQEQNWRTVSGGPTTTTTKDQRLRLVHATPSLRMPATLARVLLKQELREALTKRQQQLEASEIEANQRQYSIQRYLHTGIYPQSVGLQPTIPRTVHCSLPPELLAGCKIHYRPPPATRATAPVTTSAVYTSAATSYNRSWTSTSAATPFRSTTALTKLPSYRDASIMTEPGDHSKIASFPARLPRVVPSSRNTASMTVQSQDAETQTWATTGSSTFSNMELSRRKEPTSRFGRGVGSGPSAVSKTVSTSTEDLLDRERDHGMRRQHRKLRSNASGYYSASGTQHQSKRLSAYFSDEEDDSLTREMRKSKIKDEIARRKQTMSGRATDLSQGLPPYYASDYSSHVPHYGSLPRMDFPSRHPFPHEEGPTITSAMDAYSVQSQFMPPPRRALSVGGGGDGDYFPTWRGYNGRGGLNEADYFSDFGDYMPSTRMDPSYYSMQRPLHSSSAGALRQISSSAPYLNLHGEAPSYGRGPSIGATDSGLLSHYASYLNREFANSATALTTGPSESWRRGTGPESWRDSRTESWRGVPETWRGTAPEHWRGTGSEPWRGTGSESWRSTGPESWRNTGPPESWRRTAGSEPWRGSVPETWRGSAAEAWRSSDPETWRSTAPETWRNTSSEAWRGAVPESVRGTIPDSLRGTIPELMRGTVPGSMRDTNPESWRSTALAPGMAADTAFAQRPLPTTQSSWPRHSHRGTHGYDIPQLSQSIPWRPSTSQSYRSALQNQPLDPHQALSAGTRGTSITDPQSYSLSTFPDRSWTRNSYRPAYQHPYLSAGGSLPSSRAQDIGPNGTWRNYDVPQRAQPYWHPLEISAAPGSLDMASAGVTGSLTGAGSYQTGNVVGAGSYPTGNLVGAGSFPSGNLVGAGSYPTGNQVGVGSYQTGNQVVAGSYPAGNLLGAGFGSTIRYDSGYSSGGAGGAGYLSDSYHSNIGDRQQSRPLWSSTDIRPPLNGYLSDSTLERRRFKTATGTIPSGYDTFRSTNQDLYKYTDVGSRIKRVLLTKMGKEKLSNGSGLGMKIVGGKIIPGTEGSLGAFVTSIHKGGLVDTLGEVKEGDQILEWNGVPLTGKTYEDVQRVIENSQGEIEIVLRSFDNNNNKFQKSTDMIREDSEPDYRAMNGYGRMNGIMDGMVNGNQSSYTFRQGGLYNEPPTDGKASPCFSTTPRSRSPLPQGASYVTGLLRIRVRFDCATGTLFVHVLSARGLRPRSISAAAARSGYPNPFVKVYLLPGRVPENKRRTKFVNNTCNPEWDQTVVYKDLRLQDLPARFLEFTVWDYDRFMENQFLGRVVVSLADPPLLSGVARYYPLQPLA